MRRGAGTAVERKRGPVFFGDLTSQVVVGGGPRASDSGRIPNGNWGPCSTSSAAPFTGMRPAKAAGHRHDAANTTINLIEVAA